MQSNFYKNYSNYAIGSLVNILLGFVILYLLSQNISQTQFGKYGVLMSMSAILMVLINGGSKEKIYNNGIRKDPFAEWIYAQYTRKVILFGIIAGIVGIFDVSYFLLLCFALSFSTLQVVNFHNRGEGRFILDSWAIPIQRLIFSFLFLIIASVYTVNLNHVFVVLIVSTLIAFFCFRRIRYCTELKKGGGRRLLNTFFLIEVSSMFYLKYDVIWGGLNLGFQNISKYYICIQIFEASIAFLLPVSFIFLKKSGLALTTNDLIKYVLILLPITLMGLFFNYFFLDTILFKVFSNFASVSQYVSPLIFAAFLGAINSLLSGWIIAIHKEKLYLYYCLFAAALSLLIVPMLANEYGVLGLAYSKLLIELVISLACLYSFFRLRNYDLNSI